MSSLKLFGNSCEAHFRNFLGPTLNGRQYQLSLYVYTLGLSTGGNVTVTKSLNRHVDSVPAVIYYGKIFGTCISSLYMNPIGFLAAFPASASTPPTELSSSYMSWPESNTKMASKPSLPTMHIENSSVSPPPAEVTSHSDVGAARPSPARAPLLKKIRLVHTLSL